MPLFTRIFLDAAFTVLSPGPRLAGTPAKGKEMCEREGFDDRADQSSSLEQEETILEQKEIRSSGTNPKMSFSLPSSFLPKKWRKMAVFRRQNRHFSLFRAGAANHKPLIWLLLCRPTFLAPET